jgi:hypothetical protein
VTHGITHMKLKGLGLLLVLALLAPVIAHGASVPVTAHERGPQLAGASTPGGAVTEEGGSGLTRRDAAIAGAILVLIVGLGLWGHFAVGAAVGGVAALVGAGASVIRSLSATKAVRRAWSVPAADRRWRGRPTDGSSPS